MRSAAIVLIGVLVLGACGGSAGTPGGTAGPSGSLAPSPGASGQPTTAPISSEVPTVNPSTEPPTAAPFVLKSPAFAEGGPIPRDFTCDGDDTSPPLEWTGLPDRTAALALVVDDPDARGFVHWVAYDIDPATTGLAAGASTAAGAPPQGRNDFGRIGYGGPCPPSGTHHYVFRLIALDRPIGQLGGVPTADAVLAAANGHVLDDTSLTGTYQRSR